MTITFMKYFIWYIFFFHYVVTYFLIKMVVTFCDLDDENISLHVLNTGS